MKGKYSEWQSKILQWVLFKLIYIFLFFKYFINIPSTDCWLKAWAAFFTIFKTASVALPKIFVDFLSSIGMSENYNHRWCFKF